MCCNIPVLDLSDQYTQSTCVQLLLLCAMRICAVCTPLCSLSFLPSELRMHSCAERFAAGREADEKASADVLIEDNTTT